MMTSRLSGVLLVAGICLVQSGWSGDRSAAAEDRAGSAHLFPASTVAYAQWDNPDALMATIFEHPLRARVESLPPYQMAKQTAGYRRFQVGRVFVETHFEMSWREAVQTYAAKGISVGFDAESQGVAIVIHGKDAATMEKFRDKLVGLAEFGGDPDAIKSGEYRGVTAYEINKAKFAVHGDRMVVTNNGDLGQALLDRLIDGGGQSLDANERFQVAASERADDVTAWAFVDVATIRQSGGAEAIYQRRIDNPVLEVIFGGIQSVLQETDYLTAAVRADKDGVGLQVAMPYQAKWIPERREYYFGPAGAGRGPTLPEVPETLFTLSTYRDLSEMWLRAGDLFGENTNDEFAKADANLTTLFAGRDFGEDILGSLEPEVGLIAARHEFGDALPRPTIKLPAFALVLELRDPETMSRELRRTFQSLIGFLNVIGAQNGQNQLELDDEDLEGGAELVSASFVPEEDDRESTEAKIIFNFSPTVGFHGRRFVVASTKSLAKELIASGTSAGASSDPNLDARLRSPVLRQLLTDNREHLIAQNMLEDGNSREEAAAAIDLLLEVVGYFRDASLRLETDDSELRVNLQVRVGE